VTVYHLQAPCAENLETTFIGVSLPEVVSNSVVPTTTDNHENSTSQAACFSFDDASMPLPNVPFVVSVEGVDQLLISENQPQKQLTSVN